MNSLQQQLRTSKAAGRPAASPAVRPSSRPDYDQAGIWLAGEYEDVLDLRHLIFEARRDADGDEDRARRRLGLSLKCAVKDMLRADPGANPWQEAAGAALVSLIDWTLVAHAMADRYPPEVLEWMGSSGDELSMAADAAVAEIRAAEAGEELAGDVLLPSDGWLELAKKEMAGDALAVSVA